MICPKKTTKKSSVKVNKRDGTPPTSDKYLLAELREYFSSLLNSSNDEPPSELPPPAAQDLPIETNPPTREETLLAICQMKQKQGCQTRQCNYSWSTSEWWWWNGGHYFCTEVFSSLIPPSQWTTSIIVPLPKKGDLSLMTNHYRGISLLSITAKVYNKILLNRIRDHVDPILRNNQAGFRPGRS